MTTRTEQLPGPTADGAGSRVLNFNRAFVLALMKGRLDFFQGSVEGDGTMETQGQDFHPNNSPSSSHITISHV